MNQKKQKASRRGKSRTSSKEQNPEPNYEIIEGMVIVTCPQGHKNQGQKVSDKHVPQRLVCANTTCKVEWTETLPQIASLEEA